MTSSRPYPQVFLDTNALVKVAYSISHYRRDKKGRKSYIHQLIEMRITAFTTGRLQLSKAFELIKEGETETLGFNLSDYERLIVIEEVMRSINDGMLRIVYPEDVDKLSVCRKQLYDHIVNTWPQLAHWDNEDADMLSEAALAYSRYGLIETSNGRCRLKPMILVSDDKKIAELQPELNRELRNAALMSNYIEPLAMQYESPIIHVLDYFRFKKLVKSQLERLW